MPNSAPGDGADARNSSCHAAMSSSMGSAWDRMIGTIPHPTGASASRMASNPVPRINTTSKPAPIRAMMTGTMRIEPFTSRSDTEDVFGAGNAGDIGREGREFVAVIALALVAVRQPVIGQVQDAPRRSGHVPGGGMGDIAVEQQHVARIRRNRLQPHFGNPPVVQRAPFLSQQALFVPAT